MANSGVVVCVRTDNNNIVGRDGRADGSGHAALSASRFEEGCQERVALEGSNEGHKGGALVPCFVVGLQPLVVELFCYIHKILISNSFLFGTHGKRVHNATLKRSPHEV